MDSRDCEKEKETLLSYFNSDQIQYYQDLIDNSQTSPIVETVQYIMVEDTEANG